MSDKLFNDKLLFLESVFNYKITPYKMIDGKEIGTLKSGGELILEYQHLLSRAAGALCNNKINTNHYAKIKIYLQEIYNKYISNNDILLEEKGKRK